MAELLLLASVAALALALALPYTLACALVPFGACRRCHRTDPLCRACDGTGRRVRLGRRFWTYLRALYREGNR
jgi:cytochrome c oxidase assembly factor CtaG